MNKIIIKDLNFKTIIGLLKKEKVKKQRVSFNLTISSTDFISYAEVCKIIESEVKKAKFDTVENCLETLVQILKIKFNSIKKVKIKILKLDIIKNAKVGAKIKVKY